MNPTQASAIPNYFVLPSSSGAVTDCVGMKLPSTGTIIILLIISWIIYLVIAYIIYWFINKFNPGMKWNYWMVLLILILSSLIVSLFAWLIK